MSKANKFSKTAFSIEKLRQVLFVELALPHNTRFAVACSGGCDSVVLLHAMSVIAKQANIEVEALHFDHALSDQSAAWCHQCRQWCHQFDVGFKSHRSTTWNHDGKNLESAAREARYTWFESILEPNQVLLTAHHADDQIETVLLNLFRGRSSQRLANIARSRPLSYQSAKRVVRPLLGFHRHQIRDYAHHHRLQWIEDPTNQDIRYDRNYLRHEVIPLIAQRWSKAGECLLSATARMDRIVKMKTDYIETVYRQCLRPERKRVFCLTAPLSLEVLHRFNENECLEVLRLWIHKAGKRSPSDRQLASVVSRLLSQETRGGTFEYRDYAVRKFDHLLFFTERFKKVARQSVCWDYDRHRIPELDIEIVTRSVAHHGIDLGKIDKRRHQLVWRRGGERVILCGQDYHHSLKKVYQEKRVPPWERDLLPFIADGSTIVWVHGIGVMEGFQCAVDKVGLLPEFRRL